MEARLKGCGTEYLKEFYPVYKSAQHEITTKPKHTFRYFKDGISSLSTSLLLSY